MPAPGKNHSPEVDNAIATRPSEDAKDEQPAKSAVDHDDMEKLRSTKRLFIRNLPYGVKAEDLESGLRALLEPYGDLEGVSIDLSFSS